MKVRITKLQAGPQGVRTVGQVCDLTPHEAESLISAGAAEATGTAVVPVAIELEQATAPEPEVESRPEPVIIKRRRGRRSTSR